MPSHSPRQFAAGDNEKNKTIVIFLLYFPHLYPRAANFLCAIVMSSLKGLNRLPSIKAFSAAEKWTVRSTGVGGFISPQKRKPATLKRLESFS